ncbi:alpha/beta hydrolase [Altererythrobacter sp. JGD-16]|uniref:Alpha/beta hydrolase n=2 Tax=Altererythrobacter lutimaris TaxID=2743979 RepID=A0A850H9M0_9SPHN|nr:alpha/beta hydrolase [Altererythrobacter lutimaris]
MRRLLKITGVIAGILAICFVIFRTPDTDPAEMRAKYASEPSQFVTLPDGTEVHYRDEGPRDALPILLLHGSNADLSTWQPWAEALRDDYRVIRFDQAGHGLTGKAGDSDYTRDGFIADILAFADTLKLERFVIGGNSMGGSHSVGFAIAHPERLAGMILVDAGGAPVRREESSGNTGFSIAAMPGVRQIAKQITPRSLIERSLRQSVSNQNIVTEAMIDRYWEMLRYPGNRAATIERFSIGWSSFDESDVGQITAPTLILWGEEDTLIPLSAGEWYADTLPNAQLISYPGIGHLPQEEAADQTVGDVQEWLVSAPLSIEGSETSSL